MDAGCGNEIGLKSQIFQKIWLQKTVNINKNLESKPFGASSGPFDSDGRQIWRRKGEEGTCEEQSEPGAGSLKGHL
ncbi:hypothetical protein [Desulfonatronum parangueonense]